MGNVNCDSSIMRNKVATELNTSCNELEDAANIISSIKIPATYASGGDLANVSSTVRESKENINKIKGDVLQIAQDFEEAEEKNRNILNNILGGKSATFLNGEKSTENKKMTTSELILNVAQQVHDEQKDWIYYEDHPWGALKYGDIEASLNNENKTTCCATYVSGVLYRAGYFSKEEMNRMGV